MTRAAIARAASTDRTSRSSAAATSSTRQPSSNRPIWLESISPRSSRSSPRTAGGRSASRTICSSTSTVWSERSPVTAFRASSGASRARACGGMPGVASVRSSRVIASWCRPDDAADSAAFSTALSQPRYSPAARWCSPTAAHATG
nr:hypothetical protein [Streptomyces sp. Termitarium-T10T-6]